jgi:hypothetical protein
MPSFQQHGYDDQALIGYLLGSASEEETERLDELSIADDEFAARLRAAEHNLVDCYVRGELKGAILERFESFYLASAERRSKVEFAESLKTLTDRSRGAGFAAETPQAISPAREATPRVWHRKGFWSVAAAAVVILAAAYLLRENRSARTEVAQQQPPAAAVEQGPSHESPKQPAANPGPAGTPTQTPPAALLVFALAPQTRGLAPVPSLKMPIAAGPVEFRLTLESDDFVRYQASLRDNASNRMIWQSESLESRPGEGTRVVSVVAPGGLFQAQNYTFELTGNTRAGATESVGAYVFRVVHE